VGWIWHRREDENPPPELRLLVDYRDVLIADRTGHQSRLRWFLVELGIPKPQSRKLAVAVVFAGVDPDERLAAHLKPDVRRWALCPDPDGTSEDHSHDVGELADAGNLRQHPFDRVDLINGKRFAGDDVDMEVAPFKRRDNLFSRDAGDDPSRIGHVRSSSDNSTRHALH
jgi:hypothetical protein